MNQYAENLLLLVEMGESGWQNALLHGTLISKNDLSHPTKHLSEPITHGIVEDLRPKLNFFGASFLCIRKENQKSPRNCL
jgi:hypothetical protein